MFQMVDRAYLAPQGCMICGSSTGPLLDMMQEFSAQQLRLYLCKIHYTQVARDTGLVKGDAMDALLRVRDELTVARRELEEARERWNSLVADAKGLYEGNEQLRSQLTLSQEREAQVQAQLLGVREATTATLAATTQVSGPTLETTHIETGPGRWERVTVPPDDEPEEEFDESARD